MGQSHFLVICVQMKNGGNLNSATHSNVSYSYSYSSDLSFLFSQNWASQRDVTQKGLTLIHSDNVTDTYAHTRHFSINVDYFLASHLFSQPTSEQRDEALGTERSSPWAALSVQQSQRAGRDGLLASGTQRRGRHEARSAARSASSALREP